MVREREVKKERGEEEEEEGQEREGKLFVRMREKKSEGEMKMYCGHGAI